ncbi:10899_t:CDS:2, partial [Acaulospora morrowiae]
MTHLVSALVVSQEQKLVSDSTLRRVRRGLQITLAQLQTIPSDESSNGLIGLNGFDHVVYNDGTILLRVTAPGDNGCNRGLSLRLIYPDGKIVNVINGDLQIPSDNFCSVNGTEFTKKTTVDLTSGGIPDSVRVYAIPDNYILVTYFPNRQTYEVRGLMLNWSGQVIFSENFNVNIFALHSNTSFGVSCDDSEIVPNHNTIGGGFLRVCYVRDQSIIQWTKWSSTNGTMSVISNGTLTTQNRFSNFTTDLTKIFATEKGDYCIITSNYTSDPSTWKIFTSFITPANNYSSPSSVVGPLQIYETATNDTSLNIRSCSIRYTSFGYKCLVQNGQRFVIINFISSGSVLAVREIQNPLPTPSNITATLPLFYGGILVITQNSTQNAVNGWVFSDTNVSASAQFPTAYRYLQVGVFLNNSVWMIGVDANLNEWKIATFSNFSEYSIIDGGAKNVPGGPGPYGTAYIQSTSPLKDTTSLLRTVSELTIICTEPPRLSTGNISIWQSNSSTSSYDIYGQKYDILRQTTSGLNSKFVLLAEDGKTVKVK